jgi:hypothetical protein
MTHRVEAGNPREVRLEHLLGRVISSKDGRRTVGRVEEFRATLHDGQCEVTDYVIGVAGLAERFGLGVRLLFGRRGGGYLARWDQIDIKDPDKPRLQCLVEELRKL